MGAKNRINRVPDKVARLRGEMEVVKVQVEYRVQNGYRMDGTKYSQVYAEIKWPQPTEIKGTPLGRGVTRESAFADLSERVRIESGVLIAAKQ